MSIQSVSWVMSNAEKLDLTPTQRLVLIALCYSSDIHGITFVKNPTIVKFTGQSLKTVKRGITSLVESGAIAARATTIRNDGGKGPPITILDLGRNLRSQGQLETLWDAIGGGVGVTVTPGGRGHGDPYPGVSSDPSYMKNHLWVETISSLVDINLFPTEGSVQNSNTPVSIDKPTVKTVTEPQQKTLIHEPSREQEITEVLDRINALSGQNFQVKNSAGKLTEGARMIETRLKEGYAKQVLIGISVKMYARWKGTESMNWYRPTTLFRPKNIDEYNGMSYPEEPRHANHAQ